MAFGTESAKDDGKGIMETLFGETSVRGRKGLMFVGFIAPAGLADLGRLFSDPGQVEALVKKVGEEASRREAEKHPEVNYATSSASGSKRE
jgi:hypothetical protein